MDMLDSFVERFYKLNVGVIGQGEDRHERPHKPVMLLTVIDLIDSGAMAENRIVWNDELRRSFGEIFSKVRKRTDQASPENPFFYLRTDGFWHHIAKPGFKDRVRTLKSPPLIGELNDGIFHVELDSPLFDLLRQPSARLTLRESLIARYFPDSDLNEIVSQEESMEEAAPVKYAARSSAFRDLVLKAYDYQCAACGLRIRLPNEFNIVDAAHIIPFSASRNDHPTNGIALCKNHHWAFDRHLISPGADLKWRVSAMIEPRRSPGESAMAELEGERVLPPNDEAFFPSHDAIAWRLQRLAG